MINHSICAWTTYRQCTRSWNRVCRTI